MADDALKHSLSVHFPEFFPFHGKKIEGSNVISIVDFLAIDFANRCIDSMLRVLHQQRAENAHIQNLALPISRLPTEIMCRIFTAAVEEETLQGWLDSTMPVALCLGHVCYMWRSIAFELSEIWTMVNCRVAKGKASLQANNLHDWIARSKERLLSIRVSFEDELSWTDTESASEAIILTLIPHCHQWKDVDLVILKSWSPYLELVQGKVQNLEALSIRTAGHSSNPEPAFAPYFSIAPRLWKVVLRGEDYVLPWMQFLSVTLLQPSISQIFDVFRLCPYMIQGRFLDLVDDPNWPSAISAPHAALEHLTISLTHSAPFPIEDVLEHLMLPKLRRLSLALVSHDYSSLNSVKALIDRSGCPLSTLRIGGPSLSNDEIIDFLQAFTHLVHLENNSQLFAIASNDVNE